MHLHTLVASSLLASAAALKLPQKHSPQTHSRVRPRDLSIRQNSNTTAHTIELSATLFGNRFHAPVTIGGETFNLLVDTGSSDTFVIEDDFECASPSTYGGDFIEVDQSFCGYATGSYSIAESDSFDPIPGETFQAAYAAGVARGVMAFEDIELGGVTVTDQRFGLVNWSTPINVGASGVLGLAYPPITSAYELNGTIDEDDLNYQGEEHPYNPLFVNMYRRGLVAPYFSLALDRLPSDQESGSGGVMVLGGLPDVNLTSNWTTVPAEYYEDAEFRSPNGTKLHSYWATTVEHLSWGDDGTYSESYQTIVDTGAPISSVPESVAEAYNDLFEPSAVWSSVQGGYIVDCDSKAPPFSVQVGGTTFELNADDMIIHTGLDYNSDSKLCLSAISPGLEMVMDENDPTNTTELFILGASFLKGVVSVFDFGESEMRFAKRDVEGAAAALEVLGCGRLLVVVAVVALFEGIF
ncbi:pepsin-like aspartic protease [Aspergillus lucknowensis]|uniref:Aspartic peptidase domain-containing protein n=1 Tax=Aspergillus lucknowensis TaxID=176173 RepID=A0ABR4LDJ2_9EURO